MYLIPSFRRLLLERGIYGNDLNKRTNKAVPEAMGLIPATVYLVALICLQVLATEADLL